MTLPAGWTPLPFAPSRGLPQVVAATADIAVALVAVPTDLPRVLHAAPTTPVYDTTAPVPGGDALTATVLTLVVLRGTAVAGSWPPLPGRRLDVHDGAELLGSLWVADLAVTAGALVGGGPHGARISIGWRGPRPRPRPAAAEEDPYDRLV